MKIKKKPEHFKVTEIPLYRASGEGQHFYLLIERQNLNTQDVVTILQKAFSISEKDVGYAGLKDKFALTIQYFSLSLGRNFDELKLKDILEGLSFKVLEINKHNNKLKIGHLLGNKFEILISDLSDGEKEFAIKSFERIKERGFYNFYGEQRFGSHGDNGEIGLEILKGEKKIKNRFREKFYLSAFQSNLFNEWLKFRFFKLGEMGPVEGDQLVSVTGGRSFCYDPDSIEQENDIKAGKIVIAGPIFGPKMRVVSGRALEIENALLLELKVDVASFTHKFFSGTRRGAIVFLESVAKVSEKEDGLKLSFSLPKGCYATSLIEQLTKRKNDAL